MFGFFRKKPKSSADDLNPARAIEFFRRGEFLEALRRAEAMLAADPDIPMSWRFKGECLFSMKRFAESIECFERAASLGGPGTEDMFLWKALALRNDGKNERAKQVIQRFLASGDGTPQLVAKAKAALAKLG
jgi:tetratricopeptide (TPR) repeat protein